LVCIMRFAKDKEASLRLIYDALARVQGITLTHYGAIQHQETYDGFSRTEFDGPYVAITDRLLISSAARALHPFDAFAGIGRGVIEAMSLGIPAFVPVIGREGTAVLCAVTKDNWRLF